MCIRDRVGEELWEYKLSLNAVNYNYCQNGKEVQGNPYARVCQVNFAVTDHYLMQKWSVSSQTNSFLKDYFLLNVKSLYEATDLKKVDMVSNLNYATLSTKLTTLTNNLIAKYEKIAVNATIDVYKRQLLVHSQQPILQHYLIVEMLLWNFMERWEILLQHSL